MTEPVYRGLGLLGHNDVRTFPNFHVAFLTLTIRALMGLVKTYVYQISRWISSDSRITSYPQLVGVRICLGVAESGLVCGIFYLYALQSQSRVASPDLFHPHCDYRYSLWYPKYMLQTRIAMFWAGAGLSGAFSGLLAFCISFMSGTAGLLGWSWIFVGIAYFALRRHMLNAPFNRSSRDSRPS